MKKKDQQYFIVHFLMDNPDTTRANLKEICTTHGICSPESFETTFKQLESKSYVTVKAQDKIDLHVTDKLLRKLSKSKLAQSI